MMILNGCDVDAEGTKRWYKNGDLHREDGPAIECSDGSASWYYKSIFVGYGDKPDPTLWARLTSTEINGGPLLNGCIVDLFGNKSWYKDDLNHREDGPAYEYTNGSMSWSFNGELLSWDAKGFWKLWDRLTPEQRGNPNLLKWMPR